MDYIEFFTEAINEYRIQNNLNISQFAERLGVSEQCVSNWLTRHNGPSLELLISVANLLNCSLDYLVGRSQSPEYVPADNGFIFNERLSLLLK
ncbi:MAG: helix-turn-helix domain-containing protein, partial [Christensenellaceae bacterium]